MPRKLTNSLSAAEVETALTAAVDLWNEYGDENDVLSQHQKNVLNKLLDVRISE